MSSASTHGRDSEQFYLGGLSCEKDRDRVIVTLSYIRVTSRAIGIDFGDLLTGSQSSHSFITMKWWWGRKK
jgi:hypothetical protein